MYTYNEERYSLQIHKKTKEYSIGFFMAPHVNHILLNQPPCKLSQE